MRFRCGHDGLVHLLERMWDTEGVQHMYTTNVEYLLEQCPMNMKFICGMRTLWMKGTDDVMPTEDEPTCLACVGSK